MTGTGAARAAETPQASGTSLAPVAIVTGAGTGMGRETCRELAGHGYQLVLAGRRPDLLDETARLCAEAGVKAVTVAADIAEPDSAAMVVNRAIAAFGRLDALVNDAGTATMGPLEDMRVADIEHMFAVNVVGPLLLIQAAIAHLRRSDRAAIVNITSGAGVNSSPRAVAYGASKAALTHATRSLARELGPVIRVNAIVPGTCRTEIWQNTGLSPDAIEARLAELGAMVPAGRVGDPAEVARWVWAFLDPASAWVTGAVLSVDGGFTA
jgi:NAD(P)-dependent dehydrogenase (short-subunit alcohol dehydrogenase family)